ncbi:MAG: energy transducer TonB [Bacteroidales bacterium]|jgi:hypothetical protein|nr:energy transducer TonB [Bacteroidales bacterium]
MNQLIVLIAALTINVYGANKNSRGEGDIEIKTSNQKSISVTIPKLYIKKKSIDKDFLLQTIPEGKYKAKIYAGKKKIKHQITVEKDFRTVIEIDSENRLVKEEFIPFAEDRLPPVDPDNQDIYIVADKMPKFLGGDLRVAREWLNDNTKNTTRYLESGQRVKVNTMFVIDTDGYVSDVIVLKCRSEAIKSQAIRRIKKMPRWTPGLQRGIRVKVKLNMPLEFIGEKR